MVNNKDKILCKMELTPLIDICLVLLIVFMVYAPLKTYKLNCGITQNSSEEWNLSVPYCEMPYLFVSISNNGTIKLNGSQIEESDLVMKLIEYKDVRPQNRNVVLLAPDNFLYSRVVKYIDLIKSSHVDNISLQIQFNNKVDFY